MYNRLDDYVDDLEKRFKALETTDKIYFENKIQQRNIKHILTSLSNAVDYKEYKSNNFFIASTDYNSDDFDVFAQFAKKDDLTYDEKYDENFFKNFIGNKIKPLLAYIDNYFKSKENLQLNLKHDNRMMELLFMIGVGLASGCLVEVGIYKVFNKKQNKKIDKILDLLQKAPPHIKEYCKIKAAEYAKKEIQLTKEGLKEVPFNYLNNLIEILKKR